MHTKYWLENIKGDHLEDVRIILKWTGLNWFRTGFSSWLLQTQ